MVKLYSIEIYCYLSKSMFFGMTIEQVELVEKSACSVVAFM